MESLMQDVRYGWRMLAKSLGFTAVAVLTLALGIGASTAIFSVVDTVLLRPLPYRDPGQLVLVSETLPQMSSEDIGVSAGEFQDYRDRNRSFSQVAAYESAGFNLTGDGQPLRVNAAKVSASIFPLLGVSPELGRVFTSDEERYGVSSTVVISHALWQHQYASDPNILGKTVKLDEKPFTVVGVMPAWFRFPFDGAPLSEMADLWTSEAFDPHLLKPENRTQEFGVRTDREAQTRCLAATGATGCGVHSVRIHAAIWLQRHGNGGAQGISVRGLRHAESTPPPVAPGYGCGVFAADRVCQRGQPVAGPRQSS